MINDDLDLTDFDFFKQIILNCGFSTTGPLKTFLLAATAMI